jgi:hypothetical protein
MVERSLSIAFFSRCYSSEVELSAAVRMVRGSIPRDTLLSEGRWFDPTFSQFVFGGIAQSGERQTEVLSAVTPCPGFIRPVVRLSLGVAPRARGHI